MNIKDLAHVIHLAAEQIDMAPQELITAAIEETIEDPFEGHEIGDLAGAFNDGEKVGLIALINKLLNEITDYEIAQVRQHLPR